MATKLGILDHIIRTRSFSSSRTFSAGRIIFSKPSKPGSSRSQSGAVTDVPGLSSAVVSFPSDPVGPGAAKNTGYKNPEYFCYHNTSYFEADVEMLKYRLPQPSSKK